VTLSLANGTYTFVAKGYSAGGIGTSATLTVIVFKPSDLTPPTVCFTSPSGSCFDFVPGKGITVCVQATDDKSSITNISMTVNGVVVAMTPTGLGTKSVNDSVPLTISAPGTYTVVCTAVSAGGTGSATKTLTFTIGYHVTWTSPSDCNNSFKSGSTVPIAFSVKDDNCNAINDGTVQVVISENGQILQTSILGSGTTDVHYSCGNYGTYFKSGSGNHSYKVQVYFRGAAGSPLVLVDSSSFSVGSSCYSYNNCYGSYDSNNCYGSYDYNNGYGSNNYCDNDSNTCYGSYDSNNCWHWGSW